MTRLINCIDKGSSRTFHPPSRKLFNYRYQPISKSIDDLGRKNMNELPPVTKGALPVKPKVVLFYKNGDRNFRGHHVTVTPRRFRSFDGLLSELTRITNLAQGARFVFTPVTGTRVTSLGELVDGQAYVCGSYPKFKKINYSHAPDGYSRQRVSEKNFIPAHANSRMKVETPEKLPVNVKPKIITIVRNSVSRPKKSVKVLLNKRTAQTYDQVLNDITEAAGVEGGCVRKLYNIDGKLVKSLTELFTDARVFIAVGNERFRISDLPHIIEDLGIKTTSSAIKISPTLCDKLSKQKTNQKDSPPKEDIDIESVRPSISSHKKLPDISPGSRHSSTPTGISEVIMTNNDLNNNIDGSNEHIVFEDKSSNNLLNKKHPLPSIRSSDSSRTTTSDRNDLHSSFNSKHGDTDAGIDDDKSLELVNDVLTGNADTDSTSESNTGSKATTEVDKHDTSTDSESETSKVLHVDLQDNVVSKSAERILKTELSSTDEASSSQSRNSSPIKLSMTISRDKDSTNTSSTSEDPSDKKLPSENSSETETSNNYIKRYVDHQLPSSEEITLYYEIGEILGDGNFAVVKTAIDKHLNTMYALKIIDASKIKGKEEMLKNEILIQRESCHPNIVQLIHDFHSPTEIFLVMELITGGDLFDLIAENIKFEEEEASLYTRDLCSGLGYLHKRSIIHRDIKPENLMVCISSGGSTSLKIADFGLAQKVTKPIFTICGTPTYVAPEILKEHGYGLEVDVWAAGVIVYIMLCGFPPFRSPNRRQSELFDLIETGEFEFLEPYWDDISDSAKELISNMLVVDISKRFTCKDILNHSWLTQYGLTRNDTMDVTPRSSRFKIAAKSIQSIERMKKLHGAKLERGENFIGSVTSQSR